MKQGEKFEKMHEREKNLVVLEDMSVINALMILVLALIFLIDIARYQWILLIILILGIFLNLTLVLCGFLRRKWVFCGIALVMTLGYLGALIYLRVL